MKRKEFLRQIEKLKEVPPEYRIDIPEKDESSFRSLTSALNLMPNTLIVGRNVGDGTIRIIKFVGG